MHKIGVLGGTFNPIHMGHLLLAQWAMDAVGLEEVWIMPSGVSYLKKDQDVLPADERMRMAELAAMDNPCFSCVSTEIKREGNSYTYETMEELREENPDAKFYFITGADCLFSIENWKEPQRIFNACTLISAARGVPMEEMEKKKEELERRFHGEIILLPFMDIPISSTQVRERAAAGQSIRYLVPEAVRIYIEEKGLYREQHA